MKKKQILCACIMTLFVLGSADVAYALPTATEVYQQSNTAVPLEKTGEFNGHSYCVFNLSAGWDGEWAAAKRYCESVGGHLATITSKEENEYVYQFMKDSGYNDAFFGFTDEEEEGVWKWVTSEPVSYTNWKEGEPNNDVGGEDYAMFYHNYADKWNDGAFGDLKAFICEWEYLLSTQKDDIAQWKLMFQDVPAHAWYSASVHYAAEQEYVRGYPDGTFRPQNTITRAEGISLISRYCRDVITGTVTETGFNDVANDAWYAKTITMRGRKFGGVEENKFYPDESCTREDFAVGLYYALGFDKQEWSYVFNDLSQFSADMTYRNAAFAMGVNKIMVGDSNGNFNPKKSITRAEAAQILYNMSVLNIKGPAILDSREYVKPPIDPDINLTPYEHNILIVNSWKIPSGDVEPYNGEYVNNLSNSIVDGLTDDYEKLKAIYQWVTDNIYYDEVSLNYNFQGATVITQQDEERFAKEGFETENEWIWLDGPTTSAILRRGICYDYSVLIQYLLKTQNIHCNIVKGYVDEVKPENEHAWNAAYINNRWILMDATFDSGNTYRDGKYTPGKSRNNYFDISLEKMSKDHIFMDY